MIIEPALTITYNKFPTHVATTKEKFVKINAQQLYSANIHHMERAKIVNKIKAYYSKEIIANRNEYRKILDGCGKIWLDAEFHVPINYGLVKMMKSKTIMNEWSIMPMIQWNKAQEGYIPNWDLDNVNFFYSKTFQDSCSKLLLPIGKDYKKMAGIIKDDNVSVIKKCPGMEFIEVDDFADRKLVFKFYDYEKMKKAQALAAEYLKSIVL
jgi:hypothetical protein